MTKQELSPSKAGAAPDDRAAWLLGVRDALPLLGGYIPVAISFGLVATQAGFSAMEATLISTFIYAGASQFLFVAMVASGAPLWLVVAMTLLINARHLVYAPNLAPYIPSGRRWFWLMHGLTDQLFALSLTRLPELAVVQRLGWYVSAATIAWLSWIVGTAVGAVAGGQLVARWPLLGEVLPFALPALFIVLLAPRFNNRQWALSLSVSMLAAILLKLIDWSNAAIPLAALCGAVLFYLQQPKVAQLNAGGAHG